jgi:hypothetical protein
MYAASDAWQLWVIKINLLAMTCNHMQSHDHMVRFGLLRTTGDHIKSMSGWFWIPYGSFRFLIERCEFWICLKKPLHRYTIGCGVLQRRNRIEWKLRSFPSRLVSSETGYSLKSWMESSLPDRIYSYIAKLGDDVEVDGSLICFLMMVTVNSFGE